jgi:hypothetical protein
MPTVRNVNTTCVDRDAILFYETISKRLVVVVVEKKFSITCIHTWMKSEKGIGVYKEKENEGKRGREWE